MSEPYVGQILTFGGNFAPVNYMTCSGQSLYISQYATLFNLIGTTYGGNGTTTFNLPDLRGRVPIHQGTGLGLSTYVIGQTGGVESVTLAVNQMPTHNHGVNAVTGQAGAGASAAPTSAAYLADEYQNPATNAFGYVSPGSGNQVNMAGVSVTQAGGGIAHENRQPFMAILYCIAVFGVYPSQT
jgi:microcystin-dependent protein